MPCLQNQPSQTESIVFGGALTHFDEVQPPGRLQWCSPAAAAAAEGQHEERQHDQRRHAHGVVVCGLLHCGQVGLLARVCDPRNVSRSFVRSFALRMWSGGSAFLL